MAEFWKSFSITSTGWPFMWTLLVVAGFMITIAIERTRYIYLKSNINAQKFMAQIRKWVAAKDYKRAIGLCMRFREKALPQIVLAALVKTSRMKEPNFHVVQNAVDEGTLEVIPKLQARTAYLAMIGNVATLIGLMGTIYGLIVSFRSVGDKALNQATRATELASGISVAMNTTLTGLAIAIPSIMVYTILRNKTNQIIDEIDEHTVKLINLITPEEKV